MDKAISIASVCEILSDIYPTDGEKVVSVESINEAYDKIIKLPTIRSEQRWIPCSERLPEESGRYLVTNTQWGTYHVDWNIYYVNVEGHCDGWLWEQGCIAWMPLPEPYRGERTEE